MKRGLIELPAKSWYDQAMRAILKNTILIFILSLFAAAPFRAAHAQIPSGIQKETLEKATVQKILDEGVLTSYGMTNPYQTVLVKMLDGEESGKQITIEHGRGYNLDKNQLVAAGDTVVVSKIRGASGKPIYQIIDRYRLDQLATVAVLFFLAIIVLAGWKGLGSILGMAVSLAVVARFIIPQILAGRDPLLVSIIGCLVIMVSTIYLAHGFSKKTTIALVSTFITLVATGVLATLFVHMTHLTGFGSEDAYSLKLGPTGNINFRGLLLGGILIGTLGVLDDITTSLTASVFELAKANPKYTFRKLFAAGLTIGTEHIASLVNTLVLAYAGASLPVFLTLVLNPNHYPLWSILNSEMIVEEIVRTLAGSIGLVAAVPLTTFLASFYISELAKKRVI